MIRDKTNTTAKNYILRKYLITFVSTVLLLILPRAAHASEFGALIFVPIAVYLTMTLSVFIAVFIKFVLFRARYSADTNFSLKSFFPVMSVELGIMYVCTTAFLAYTSKNYDVHVAGYLSYLSTDVALLYFQKIVIEGNVVLSLIGRSLILAFGLSFINFIPNYKLLTKHLRSRQIGNKHLGLTFMLGTIAPVLFCIIILSLFVATQQEVLSYGNPKYKESDDIKNELLRRASATGYPNLVEVILNKGADVNAGDGYMITALHEAVKIPGNADTVRLLLQRGADVNSKSNRDFTPLMMACTHVNADSEIIQLLIKSGANINSQSSSGESALKIASRRNQGIWVEKYGVKDTIIEKLLLNCGADVNIKDQNNRTALMEAAQANNIELVKLLLEHGADVNIKDSENKTAYMLTSDSNVQQILANSGAPIN